VIPGNEDFPDDKAWDSKGRKRDVLCLTVDSARLLYVEVGAFGRIFLGDTMVSARRDEEEDADGEDIVFNSGYSGELRCM